MADNILRVGAEFDVGGLVSGANEAAQAFEKIAAQLIKEGESAEAVTSALENLGVAHAQAAAIAKDAAAASAEFAATEEAVAASTAAAANSMSGLERASAQATARVLGMETGLGSLGYQVGRVASYLPGLGELFAYAFPIAIIGLAADKLYHVYENVVLLKSSIDALNKAGEQEADKAAELNYQYDISAARLAEHNQQFQRATELYEKAAKEKPLVLPQINDKEFKQFSSDFVTFMQAAHADADAPTVITRIEAEAKSVQEQLSAAQKQLADVKKLEAEGAETPLPIGSDRAQAEVTDLTAKLNLLRGMIGEIQSQTGITFNDLSTQLDAVGKTASESAHKGAEAEIEESKRAAREELESMNRVAEAQKRYAEDIDRAMEASLKRKA